MLEDYAFRPGIAISITNPRPGKSLLVGDHIGLGKGQKGKVNSGAAV
jgi:hypothetical protein